MNKQITEYLFQYLEIFWRRRFVFLFPFLLMIPVSLVFAMLMPKSYVAKSLVILQDNEQATGPLVENSQNYQALARLRLQEQIVALDAWLKSDHVLSSILQDLMGDKFPKDQREIFFKVKVLRASLSLNLIGNNALEFQLKEGNPVGLAARLEVIMSRFFEGLERPDQNTLGASQFLLTKRKEEMENAEQAYIKYKQKLADKGNTQLQTTALQLSQSLETLRVKKAELDQISTTSLETGQKVDTSLNLAEEILMSKNKIASLEQGQPSSAEDLQKERKKLEGLEKQKALQDKKGNLQSEINQLTMKISELEKSLTEYSQIAQDLPQLERRIEETRSLYEAYQKRYSTDSLSRNIGMFSSLERMVVIGRPKDPEFSDNSRFAYAVLGMLAGLMIGVGLVVVAEIIDQRVYHVEDFVTLTSSPIITRLPNGADKNQNFTEKRNT